MKCSHWFLGNQGFFQTSDHFSILTVLDQNVCDSKIFSWKIDIGQCSADGSTLIECIIHESKRLFWKGIESAYPDESNKYAKLTTSAGQVSVPRNKTQ